MEPVIPKVTEALVPLLAAAEGGSGEGGSFLVTPSLGLMIWTLIAFGITFWVLRKFAWPKIEEALDRRAALITGSIDSAEQQRAEAEKLLADYRQRLAEAREQADEILDRARKAAETTRAEAVSDGQAKREELVEAAKRDIEGETRRALDEIRREVADLTVLATERVTRKSLDDAAQRELVEEALREVDFSSLAGEMRSN